MYEMIRLPLLPLPVQQAVCSRQKKGHGGSRKAQVQGTDSLCEAFWELGDVLKWRPASPLPCFCPMKPHWLVSVGDIDQYDAIVDVRTPAEFAEDHIPGAINCPVLSDEERVRVGTLYKQVSPFEARKVGGALVSRNIARHLEERFASLPRTWHPLIYCWRGGQRSGAMQIVLRQVGWEADKLEGGYKAFRARVLEDIASLSPSFDYRIVCGATGSGKTRILQAMQARGGQVLDLEGLASHKGSVLGELPDQIQPSQKHFETLLWQQLRALDPSRPVFVEAESRRIGVLHLPEPLIARMRESSCLDILASTDARVSFLLRDYDYAMRHPLWLSSQIDRLTARLGKKTISEWQDLIAREQWPELVRALLVQHYDPLYRQSQNENYHGPRQFAPFGTDDLTEAGVDQVAQRILQAYTA